MQDTLGSRDSKLTRLAEVPLFSGCSQRELTRLGALAEAMEVEAGTRLQIEDSPGLGWFVLERGSMAVSRTGRLTTLFGPGDFWGQEALLSRQPASITVTALTATSLFVFDRRSFLDALRGVPRVSMELLKAMAFWEPAYGRHEGDLNSSSANCEERAALHQAR